MIDLTIGIVTYNGKNLLEQCLESIVIAKLSLCFEIVVIDNASTDDTIEWLRETYPQVRVIVNPENRMVAVGNNQCFLEARGRYVLLLNNDTVVLPGMLEKIVAFSDEHPEAGAIGGRLVNLDGSFQASYSDFPNLWIEFLHATRLWVLFSKNFPTHGDRREVREVDWICSACLLVRKSAAEQVGTVDETFIMYSDETDLQYRMKKAGWKIYYLPDITTIHLGGQSASHWKRRRLIYRGKLLFFQKHYGGLKTFLLRSIFAGASLLKLLIWGTYWLIPKIRKKASNELFSNWEVLKLSLARQF